jgi:Mrp family chromosome partitioning ATPase
LSQAVCLRKGKSFVAANLAMSLARNSVNNILLIDADLRRPSLHKLLGAPDTFAGIVGVSGRDCRN